MIRLNYLIFLLTIVTSASAFQLNADDHPQYSVFKVTKIEKENAWFFIHASRNDSVFLIVSEQPEDSAAFSQFDTIQENQSYAFDLHSFKKELCPRWSNGGLMLMYDVRCICLDRQTSVKIGEVGDFFTCSNLRGLYFIEEYRGTPSPWTVKVLPPLLPRYHGAIEFDECDCESMFDKKYGSSTP